jgi:hypothetical protein
MTAIALTVCVLAGVAWWVSAAPIRILAASVPLIAWHPAWILAITATATAALIVLAVVLIWRDHTCFGWRLGIATYSPRPRPSATPRGRHRAESAWHQPGREA